MDQMKRWESPEIEELAVSETAWSSLAGNEADLYEYRCDPLYNSDS